MKPFSGKYLLHLDVAYKTYIVMLSSIKLDDRDFACLLTRPGSKVSVRAWNAYFLLTFQKISRLNIEVTYTNVKLNKIYHLDSS